MAGEDHPMMRLAWLLMCAAALPTVVCAGLTIAATAAAPLPPSLQLAPQEDWHYPAEEAAEMAALQRSGLTVVQLHADSNASGTFIVRAANGTTAEARLPGDVVFGWTLRGFLTGLGAIANGHHDAASAAAGAAGAADLAVLEFESARWGLVAFIGPSGQLGPAGVSGGRCFRKGVGVPASLMRPKLDPQLATSECELQHKRRLFVCHFISNV